MENLQLQPPTREDLTRSIIDKLMSGEMKLSYTALSAFAESPKKFIDYKLGQKKITDAMVYGRMVHCLVLEPQDFEKRYLAIDDTDICNEIGGAKPRATKPYKEWYAEQEGRKGTRELVETKDYRHAKIVAENVRHNRASAKVIRMCPDREKAIEWDYKNFSFHGYIDGDGGCTFDLKNMPDAEYKTVQREIIKRGLHIQAAMYLFGNKAVKDYYIIAVDAEGGVSVHKLHDNLLAYGMERYDYLLGKFNECILTDAWDQSYDFWSDRFDGTFVAEKPGYLY